MVRIAKENDTKKQTGKKYKLNKRLSFNDICEQCRIQTAFALWQKAKKASELRHLAVLQGVQHSASIFSRIKKASAIKAIALVPDKLKFDIDDTFQIGLLSVSWPDAGSLHLPYKENEVKEKTLKSIKSHSLKKYSESYL
jgi:hypothetical protein